MSIIEVVMSLLGTMSAAVVILVWQRIKHFESKAQKAAEEVKEVRFNYLERFDELKDCIKQFELNVIERIAKLEATITKA